MDASAPPFAAGRRPLFDAFDDNDVEHWPSKTSLRLRGRPVPKDKCIAALFAAGRRPLFEGKNFAKVEGMSACRDR